MQKKIEFEEGNFIIGYCDNLQDISVYVSEQFTELIKIYFYLRSYTAQMYFSFVQ